MAQVLKQQCREKIIEVAKKEFLENGFENTSMRTIALKSGMTVGNLYRYFTNKDQINRVILKDALDEINDAVKSITDNQISISSSEGYEKINLKEIDNKIELISMGLVNSYINHPIEFNILMMHSAVSEEIAKWFSEVVKSLIISNYRLDDYPEEIEQLARCYTVSIFDGLREMFKINTLSKEKLNSLLKIYFKSYLYMLDVDVRKFIGE